MGLFDFFQTAGEQASQAGNAWKENRDFQLKQDEFNARKQQIMEQIAAQQQLRSQQKEDFDAGRWKDLGMMLDPATGTSKRVSVSTRGADAGTYKFQENPAGLVPDAGLQGKVFYDLLKRQNPDTGQPYTPLEAFKLSQKGAGAGDKPDTATEVKQRHMDLMAKANIPLGLNNKAMEAAINNSKLLTPSEKANMKAYINTNPTPTTQISIMDTRVAPQWAQPTSVIDRLTGQSVLATKEQIAANPTRYMNVAQGSKDQNATQLVDDIRQGSQQVKDALAGISDAEAFSTEAQAKIGFAMRSTDPRTAVTAIINGGLAGTLSQAQINLVDAELALMERALSLRQLGSMGQGSDMQREAIIRNVPSIMSGSRARALDQLARINNQIDILEKSYKTRLGTIGGAQTPTTGTSANKNPFK